MRDQRGSTLVEIMVAAAIVGVGLVAIAGAVPFATATVTEGHQLSTAVFLANQRLEQVRGARWESGPPAIDELGLSPSPMAAPARGGVATFRDESSLPAPYAAYARTVRIADCASGSSCGGIARPDLRQVTVTVTYSSTATIGQSGRTTQAATVTMYIAQR
jgi:prepilin-type N-terminal cleavage/methylation domain-containing protein